MPSEQPFYIQEKFKPFCDYLCNLGGWISVHNNTLSCVNKRQLQVEAYRSRQCHPGNVKNKDICMFNLFGSMVSNRVC